MAASISRRTVLSAGATGAGLTLSGVSAIPAHAEERAAGNVAFTLNAEVLDGGEQVTSLTLHTAEARLGRIDPASLTTDTFAVHAKATSPIQIAEDDLIFSEYDIDRTVTAVRLTRTGDIVLDLDHGEGQPGGGTLGYILSRRRNVQLDLAYTITQHTPLTLANRRTVTIAEFEQGRRTNPEVDAFSYHVSGSGMKYRLYSPVAGRRGHPLVVWLHGGGEGASLPDNYYDNETTLRANRGALGFATAEAQRTFGGAYVAAPQSTSFWMEDGPRFAPLIDEIINELVDSEPIDPDRIYLAGASNGGYMTMKMTSIYPDRFAAAVPICGVVQSLESDGTRLITDEELMAISTPSWLVTSRDDTTVPPEPNTIHAHNLIPDSLMTLYDHVIWNGHQFPGHWSWIYVARNDPAIDGVHIWPWMAAQRR